jgi:WD40 repeat protein
MNGHVRVWDLPAGKVRSGWDWRGFGRLLSLQGTAAGRHLVYAANPEQVVQVQDAASGQQLFSLAGHAGKVTSLALSFDEKRIATGGDDRVVRVWDVEAPRGTTLSGLGTQPYRSAVSADGRGCVVGHRSGRVTLWDIGTRREIWREDNKQIVSVALSADGRVAASVNLREEARVWKDGRGRTLGSIGHLSPKIALSPDGLRAVTIDVAVDGMGHGERQGAVGPDRGHSPVF